MCIWQIVLVRASGQIGTLQATQMSHEATIKDLQQEQSRLREKIVQLEEEKDRVQSQSQALDEQQRLQILNLEKVGHFVLLS